jgi:hypothetical protein
MQSGLGRPSGRTAPAWRGAKFVSWKGDADIRAEGGVYLEDESSGPPTGSLVDGRRVYRYGGKSHLGSLTVESVNPNRPLTDLKVWLPDPADPMNAALENRLFHPSFLARLGDVPGRFAIHGLERHQRQSPK